MCVSVRPLVVPSLEPHRVDFMNWKLQFIPSILEEMMMTPGGTMVSGLGARGPTPLISGHGLGYGDGVEAMVSSSTSFYWAVCKEKGRKQGEIRRLQFFPYL